MIEGNVAVDFVDNRARQIILAGLCSSDSTESSYPRKGERIAL